MIRPEIDRELWKEVREAFLLDHSRDPTDEEMQIAYEEASSFEIDQKTMKRIKLRERF